MKDKIKVESITLRTEYGDWLGQVVLTSDGMFFAITDWGNFGYAWRSFGDDFKEFLLHINKDYFTQKMITGMAYVAYGKKIDDAARRFSDNIFPALQEYLKTK